MGMTTSAASANPSWNPWLNHAFANASELRAHANNPPGAHYLVQLLGNASMLTADEVWRTASQGERPMLREKQKNELPLQERPVARTVAVYAAARSRAGASDGRNWGSTCRVGLVALLSMMDA